jgi:histidyl-tRNA synthetase
MGTSEDRLRYGEVLQAWLRDRVGDLDPEDQERVELHPMRVLDSKRRATRAVTEDAPAIGDHLSAESEAHFARVLDGLRAVGIEPTITPRLVRGFDYYTHTTFEFVPTLVDNAQATILGGGRYDGLVEELGGQPTPGIGFGAGIERLLIACDAEGVLAAPSSTVDVFVVDVTGGDHARDITRELRSAGLRCDRAFDQRAMRAQMKAADRSGAAHAVIVGDDEAAAGQVTVRPLAEFGAEQVRVPRSELVDHLSAAMSSHGAPTDPNQENT